MAQTSETTALLDKQHATGKAITELMQKFPTNAPSKGRVVGLIQKVMELDRLWVTFLITHEAIKARTDLDGASPYFAEEYEKTIRDVVAATVETASSHILESTGTDPKYDLINRPHGYTLSPIIKPDGSMLGTDSIPIVQLTDPSIIHSMGSRDGDDISGVNARVHELINNSAHSFRSNGSNGNMITNFLVAIAAVDNCVTEVRQQLAEDDTDAQLRALARNLEKKWEVVSQLHLRLMSSDAEHYDSAIFYRVDEQVQPIFNRLSRLAILDEQPIQRATIPTRNIKPPKIDLPTFSGDYAKWYSYKDLFIQMVHSQPFSNVEKLVYLRQTVSGEAASVVINLPITNDNYKVAWNLITKRFENPRQIMKASFNKLLDLEQVKPNDIKSLKKVQETFKSGVQAVRRAGSSDAQLFGMMLHQILLNKLDNVSYNLYEQFLEDPSIPQDDTHLDEFLVRRVQACERGRVEKVVSIQAPSPQLPKWKRSTALLTSEVSAQSPKLCNCREKHSMGKCPKFIALNPKDRYKKVRDTNRCVVCLGAGHSSRDCKSKKCSDCGKAHHYLLHFPTSQKTALLSAAGKPDAEGHVFLGTVTAYVLDKSGAPIKIRALLDSGSQISVITEKLFRRCGLKATAAMMEILGMGQSKSKSTKQTTIQLASPTSNYKTNLDVYILETVTSFQPSNRVDISSWNIPSEIQLADEQFNIPAKVDAVIGGELFYQLLANGLISLGKKLPDLQNTVFGWMVAGKLSGQEPHRAYCGLGIATNQSLDDNLAKFWAIEERGTAKKVLTDKEQMCEKFYEETTRRGPDGRFTVKLQFSQDPSILGKSMDMAIRRFYSLERKLQRDSNLKEQYINFMREYEELGHMVEVSKASLKDGECYIIPHHAVLNPGSSTTKLRVVFDASATTTSGKSLNDILVNGPMLQDDLFTILARFRTWRFVFAADIGKMYRQIEVASEDQKWQIIVWRESPQHELKYFKLKTLTYGTTCASYLAIKTLQHLADLEQENFPLAAIVAKRDFNVDDVMTGTDDLSVAMETQQQLIKLLASARMELHKWCSNNEKLLKGIPTEKREVSLEINAEKTETKALGMKWIPGKDDFLLHYQPKHHETITKRSVLSETAQLFDPLGIVNPVIVKAKIFLQELWMQKMDWDTKLSTELAEKWISYRAQLQELTGIRVPRYVIGEKVKKIELHAFSDASERAYGAAIYFRSVSINGSVKVHLLCSKSRVAPSNKVSLPRLELCGAVTAVELVKKLQRTLTIAMEDTYLWTDSEIVLSWIYNDCALKTFVANRISSIKRSTNVSDWRYIDTKQNPGDIVSRGCNTNELVNSKLWRHGPQFLEKLDQEWPTRKAAFIRDPAEEKTVKTVLTATIKEPSIIGTINHQNSIRRWQTIIAYCIKFASKGKLQGDRTGHLSTKEMNMAMTKIIKYAQQDEFSEDIANIKAGKPDKTRFKTMTPIIDADGVLRVGGRLEAATMEFEQKHPAILPYHHEVSKLIMQKLHIENMHAGPQALLAASRQKYWILKGKVLAKSIVDGCVLCSKAKPKLMEQIMAGLPTERVTKTARSFINVGLDFCGPITIHYNGRGNKTTKAYVCVFVCFATKAVHLEAATDLSTSAFLRCLKRFIARRGIPSKIFSDNATNFRGMNNQLLDLADQMNSEMFAEQVSKYCHAHKIEWKFIPPRSPHFGGLWEAAVKSAKLHLVKALHNHTLVYDELVTILAEIEAILNSRPLSPMSDDANDLQPLTPGHFLVGGPLTGLPDEYIPNTTKLQQWAKLVSIRNEFWNRWSKEYLCELQYKNKWRVGHKNIAVGTLVTLKDPNLPPLSWRMGRIIKIMTDKEGIARVVMVKTANGDFMRAIHELSPLPVEIPGDDQAQKVSSKLRPEAEEFKWNLDNQNEVQQAVNVPEIKKELKKVQQRKKREKSVAVNCNSPRTTRSGRAYGMKHHLWIGILALMTLIMGALGHECNTTQFAHNPGLYYENMGKLSLTNDEWTIVCHLDMGQYWKEERAIQRILVLMNETCTSVHPSEHCDVTLEQITHRLKALQERNELILGFADSKAKRQKRKASMDFFDRKAERKNGGRFSSVGQMAKLAFELTNNQDMEIKRVKRGWFDGVGMAAREVFGVLSIKDAEHFDKEITKLENNEDYLKQLIRNQTTIQEITTNIIRRDEEKVNKIMRYLSKSVADFHDKDARGQNNVFNSLSVQASFMMNSYAEIQNAIIEMLTMVFHGKIPPTIITPSQLKSQLEVISDNIDHTLMIPGDDQKGHISQLYTMLSAKVHVTRKTLLIRIQVPLINREHFKLYHMIPVPFQRGNKLSIIKPAAPFIGINLKQDHYYILSEEEKQNCKVYDEGLLICRQIQPLYSVRNNKTRCEMAVIMEPKSVHHSCKMMEVSREQIWTALAEDNSYLFAMQKPTEVSVICNTNTNHCTLKGTGIMRITPNCIIKSGILEISSRNVMSNDATMSMMIPSTNISDHVPAKPTRKGLPENWNDFQNDNELDVLTKLIAQQKDDSSRNLPNIHDVYHYTFSYSLLATIIIIVCAYIFRRKIRKLIQRARGQKSNRARQQSEPAHEVEMQPIKMEPKPTERFARANILNEKLPALPIK